MIKNIIGAQSTETRGVITGTQNGRIVVLTPAKEKKSRARSVKETHTIATKVNADS